MKIVFVAHGFPPNQASGAEWRAHRTARHLAARGHDVAIVAVDRSDQVVDGGWRLQEELVDGLPVHRLSFQVEPTWTDSAEYDNPWVADYLARYLAQARPDIVHLISGYRASGSAILAAKKLGVPVVLTLTDFWFLCPRITLRRRTGALCQVPDDPLACVLCLANDWRRYRRPFVMTNGRYGRLLLALWRRGLGKSPLVRRLESTLLERRRFLSHSLQQVDKIIAPSRFLADLFVEQGVASEKLIFMRQGLDSAGWLPASEPDEPPAGLHVGYIGQIAAHKGVRVLLEAFGRLPAELGPVRLSIYGDLQQASPVFRRYVRQQAEADGRIQLAGRFPNDQIAQIQAGLDVLVVPSIWYENSPNVILEAFACGTPVVASNLGGMAELVEHGRSGLLFAAGDAADLADQLSWLAADPALLAGLRANVPHVKEIGQEMAELETVYAALKAAVRA